MPAISIGMPVYNGERYLPMAIDSLLGQTFEDFELNISDNGSTDRTQEICRDYAQREPRIHYVRNQQNIGAAGNFARVFELATGPYFRWLSVDDYCAPTCLEKTKAVLDTKPDIVLCCSKVDIVGADGQLLVTYADEQALLADRPAERFRRVFMQDSWCNAIYGLMRAPVLRKTGLMGGFGGSDLTLLARLSLYGRFWEIPERLFFRRTHPQAYSHECSEDKVQAFYAPNQSSTLSLRMQNWRHLYEYFAGMLNAPIGVGQRAAVTRHILRLAWWRHRELAKELSGAMRRASTRLILSTGA